MVRSGKSSAAFMLKLKGKKLENAKPNMDTSEIKD
jgi:hypothetical protein